MITIAISATHFDFSTWADDLRVEFSWTNDCRQPHRLDIWVA